jgi:hypothetical protein
MIYNFSKETDFPIGESGEETQNQFFIFTCIKPEYEKFAVNAKW